MALGNELSTSGLKRSGWTRFKAGMAKRLGWLWQPRLYAGVLLAFLLGRALPGSLIAPFGLAFSAAVRGAGGGASAGLAVGVATVVGAWSVMTSRATLSVAAAVVLCHLACSLLRVGRRGASPLGAALVAAIASALALELAVGRPSLVPLAFWMGMTGMLGLVFTLGIAEARAGRLFHAAEGDSPVSAIVILAAALCGLDGLSLAGWLSMRDLAAAVLVMTCAYAGGPPLGAAAGGLLGVGFLFTALGAQPGLAGGLPAIASNLPQARAVAYMVAGLLAGTFRELRKGGVGIAFGLGLVTYAMVMIDEPRDVLTLSLSAAAGVLLFWLIPRGWVARLPAALAGTAGTGGTGAQRRAHARADPLLVVDRMRGIAHVLREVTRTFDQVAVVQAPVDQSPGRVFEQVTDRVCHSCSMYRQCWETEFHKTYQLYTDLWEQIDSEGPLCIQPVPAQLEQHCIKPDRVATTLNYLYDLERNRHHWESRLDEGRSVVQAYLKNINRMFERFVEEVGAPDRRAAADREAVIRAHSAIARLPKRGGLVSGDSYVGTALGQNRYLLALSDGMGVGRGAAIESKQCVKLLQEILEAGFSTEVAINTVNSALLLRSPTDSFATVDMALVDLTTGRAEFVKVGGAPSFIKRGDEVTVVKMPSVPIGIINQVEVEPDFRVLQPGDVIIMLTDGIWDLSKDDADKERWLLDHLATETASEPEEIAESLLARARELSPDAADDMTVLVARIEPVSGRDPVVQPKPQATSGWAPARVAPRFSEKPSRKRVK